MDRSATRILVVDDDRTMTRILRTMLEIEGYRVEEATGAVGLVDRMLAAPPDLLLLDLHMPQVSGLDVLIELKARLAGRVPVIMLTGDSQNIEMAVDALKEGASEYLVKPVSMEKLHAAVRSCLNLHALRQERDRLAADLQAAREELDRERRSGPVDLALDLLDRLGDGVLVVSADGRILRLNRAAGRLAGLAADETESVIGQPVRSVLRGEPPAGPFLALEVEGGISILVLRNQGAPGNDPGGDLAGVRDLVGVSVARADGAVGEGGAERPRAGSGGAAGPRAERERLLAALAASGGNKSQAARQLGIGRTTLWRKLRGQGA